jgi:hypothetical protein
VVDPLQAGGLNLNYFPDHRLAGSFEARSLGARLAILAIPALYLATASLYSAASAPWGTQVDPESAYAMNGLIAAAGYPSMKFDHPGTTTTLLVEIIIRLMALVARPDDIVAFGLKNYDAIIYAARACEAAILAGALLVGGLMVGKATKSTIAALLFQVAPFVHPDTFHFEMVLIPESLMAASAILAMALAVKAALDPNPPTVRLGVAAGLVFVFGFSSKYLFLPMAVLAVTLLGNVRAFKASILSGAIGFAAFNFIFNPGAITRGFGWMFSLATHKGIYGHGEPGFIDFDLFWINMGSIIAAAPLVFGLNIVAAMASLAQMIRDGSRPDPISRALLASFVVFAAQLVATSKHFALHYMMTSWVIAGGVLVLTIVQIRRLTPSVPSGALATTAAAGCAILISTTLYDIRRDALENAAMDRLGARLSDAVVKAGPACANVSSMFVRAPENELNHGSDMTMAAWGDQKMKDRLSDSYSHAFEIPLLDHNVYSPYLAKNFRPYTYKKLAVEYPCMVVRTAKLLDVENSHGLLELGPQHCVVEGVQVYTLGIACEKIGNAYAGIAAMALDATNIPRDR